MKTDMQMLRACMKYHNRTQEDVSRALGMVRSTFYLHMKDGDFTISQIHKMMEYIPLTMDDVNRIFFATKSSKALHAIAKKAAEKVVAEAKKRGMTPSELLHMSQEHVKQEYVKIFDPKSGSE